MASHVCKMTDIPQNKLKLVMYSRTRKKNVYTCGGCVRTFDTICVLHAHCMEHIEGGSYYFDHMTNTAFPKYDTACTSTQVVPSDFKNELGRSKELSMDCNPRLINDHITQQSANTITTANTVTTADTVTVYIDEDVTETDLEKSADDSVTFEDTTHDYYAGIDKNIGEHLQVTGTTNNNIPVASTSNNNIPVAEYIDKNRSEHFQDTGTDNYSVPVVNYIEKSDATKLPSPTKKDMWPTSNVFYTGMDKDSGDFFHVTGTDNTIVPVVESIEKSDVAIDTKLPSPTKKAMVLEEYCPVMVKNIEVAEDGSITFEMNEVDAYLFDATATVIMEKVKEMGEDWITSIRELEVLVPNLPMSGDTAALVEKTDMIEYVENDNSLLDTESPTENIETKSTDSGNEELSSVNKVSVTQPKNVTCTPSAPTRKSRRLDVEDVISVPETNKGTNNASPIKEEIVGKRSTRKRKPNPRLAESDWEQSPKKTKVTKTVETECSQIDKGGFVSKELLNALQLTADEPAESILDHVLEDDNAIQDKNVESQQKIRTCRKVTVKTENEFTQTRTTRPSSKRKTRTKDSVKLTKIKGTNPTIKNERNTAKRTITKPVGQSKKIPGYLRKDLKCEVCGKVGNKALIDYHKQMHSKATPFTCDTCGKQFKTKPCFKAHVKQHEEFKHKCGHCPATFYRKAYLTVHERQHTGETPYVCDVCGEGFKNKAIHQRHVNSKHKNIRNFECDICKQRFFRASTRNTHRARHFDPTLKCRHCAKKFKADLDLRKHEMIHTGEKQFYCPVCPNKLGFTQIWPYYKHMWTKHNISKPKAKTMRVRNPDLVNMRNKNTKYEKQEDESDSEEYESDNENDDLSLYLVSNKTRKTTNAITQHQDIEENKNGEVKLIVKEPEVKPTSMFKTSTSIENVKTVANAALVGTLQVHSQPNVLPTHPPSNNAVAMISRQNVQGQQVTVIGNQTFHGQQVNVVGNGNQNNQYVTLILETGEQVVVLTPQQL